MPDSSTVMFERRALHARCCAILGDLARQILQVAQEMPDDEVRRQWAQLGADMLELSLRRLRRPDGDLHLLLADCLSRLVAND